MKLSVCIPTHERHRLLEQRCLPSLLQQTRLPDEVVVADSSTGTGLPEFYQEWERRFHPISFSYVRTEGRSVVQNRWAAFSRSTGDVVLFADDDIQFSKEAIADLLSAFETHSPAGVGMKIHYEGPTPKPTLGRRWASWWQGDARSEVHSISPGGRSSFGAGGVDGQPAQVQWLAGGAMAFCREALLAVGPLPGLNDLFRLRISSSADTVLSNQVAQRGRLLLLTQALAWHPEGRIATSTVTSSDGWRKGLADTVGVAHIFHWLARDQSAVLHVWLVSATLGWARAVRAVLRRPFSPGSWLRLSGFLYGSIVTLLIWRGIPDTPRASAVVSRKWLFL